MIHKVLPLKLLLLNGEYQFQLLPPKMSHLIMLNSCQTTSCKDTRTLSTQWKNVPVNAVFAFISWKEVNVAALIWSRCICDKRTIRLLLLNLPFPLHIFPITVCSEGFQSHTKNMFPLKCLFYLPCVSPPTLPFSFSPWFCVCFPLRRSSRLFCSLWPPPTT